MFDKENSSKVMEENLKSLLERAREFFFKSDVGKVSIEDFCAKEGFTLECFYKCFKDKEDLIDKLLENERVSFENIFDEYDFEGMNAIDILLIVSNEVRKRFRSVNPLVTYDIKKVYPEMYLKHIEARRDFIFGKIQINLQKGISQGVYRNDVSIELMARGYISKLIDIHDPSHFMPQAFSFATLFDIMFDNFIKGVANDEGLEYYKKRKQLFSILSKD
jgi:hypothetical protein